MLCAVPYAAWLWYGTAWHRPETVYTYNNSTMLCPAQLSLLCKRCTHVIIHKVHVDITCTCDLLEGTNSLERPAQLPYSRINVVQACISIYLHNYSDLAGKPSRTPKVFIEPQAQRNDRLVSVQTFCRKLAVN